MSSRAVSASSGGTPLKRKGDLTSRFRIGSERQNDQVLLYYIKSYLAGAPDPARRAVIENAYKKVNGTLEGIDEKIGPAFTSATATPTPQM